MAMGHDANDNHVHHSDGRPDLSRLECLMYDLFVGIVDSHSSSQLNSA